MKVLRFFSMLLACATVTALAAVDLNRLIPDIQRTSAEGDSLDIVMWMPSEFWETMLEQDPRVNAAARREFLSNLGDVTIFVIISGRLNASGGVRASSRDQILDSLRLTVGERTLEPLAEDELSDGAQLVIETMGPMLGRMLGAFGEAMQFFVYRNVDDEGDVLLNPLDSGSFEVELRGTTHRWRLPLGSLMPPRYDPDTGEEFPGNYQFSPFTGKELISR